MDQFFMPLSKPYWADLPALRAELTKADEAAARETDPIQKKRAEQHADALRHQLEAAERSALAETRRAPVQPPRQTVLPPRPTVNASEPQFAECVPYFAVQAQPAAPKASAAAPVTWPKMSFIEHYELVQAAAAELRRRGCA